MEKSIFRIHHSAAFNCYFIQRKSKFLLFTYWQNISGSFPYYSDAAAVYSLHTDYHYFDRMQFYRKILREFRHVLNKKDRLYSILLCDFPLFEKAWSNDLGYINKESIMEDAMSFLKGNENYSQHFEVRDFFLFTAKSIYVDSFNKTKVRMDFLEWCVKKYGTIYE